ncbi:MAG: polysaccharide export protein [Fimbriimonadales bacterium]|nr:polysaccharide export protein [Fimbriimonadales bacterium]
MRWLLFSMTLAVAGALFAQRVEGPYRLQPEDVVVIRIDPGGIFHETLIGRDGIISVPKIGYLRAAGLTISELEQAIANRFIQLDLLRQPSVSVSIRQLHRPKVSVLGMVYRPGSYEFKEGDKVLEALSMAGGHIPERAKLEDAWLQRLDGTVIKLNLRRLLEQGDLSQNYPLQDGDLIQIPEDTLNRYFVGGNVKRPGLYTWRPGVTVLDALGQANWETERGALSRTFVIRQKPDGTTERIQVDMVKLLQRADMSQNIELQPGDVVFVSETRTPNFDELYRTLSFVWLLRNLGILNSLWRP